ncbi:MAG: replicative DNA helicase [Clostridia bacterium]|nr:replicative DNA helicase [Clostridia bacterium]
MNEFEELYQGLNMPYSLENEQSVLGAILLDPSCMNDETVATLQADYFYLPQHKAIFGVMAGMDALNKPMDFVTVLEQLRSEGVYEQAGGKEYLTQLAQLVPSIKNVGAYAEVVIDKYYVRSLIQAGHQIVEQAKSSGVAASDQLDSAEQMLYKISEGKDTTGLVKLKDILTNETIDRLSKMDNPEIRKEMQGISTGLSTVDRIIGGFHRSDLVIVGARPGMGKTSLILNIARYISVNLRKKVAFFNLEMSRDQLAQRMLSFDAAVDISRLREGGLTSEEWDRITTATSTLYESELYVDQTSNITVQQIQAKLRRNKPDIVFIDYLQLLQAPADKRGRSRVEEVSAMTRDLKIMAKELDIPVIVCSQLSRAGQQRGSSHVPQLSDLRESGSIEQDADIVLLLHRPHYYENTSDEPNPESDPNEALCIVAKNRHGPTEKAKLRWDGRYAKFVAQEDNLEY